MNCGRIGAFALLMSLGASVAGHAQRLPNTGATAVQVGPLRPAHGGFHTLGPARLKNGKAISATLWVPDDYLWDSGFQQCQIGSKKIVYRFELVRSPNPLYDWEVLYDVKTEQNTGQGWNADYNLYSVHWLFSYAGGVKPNDTGSISLNNSAHEAHSLFKGKGAVPIDTRVLTVEAGGGTHGIEVSWPNSTGCHYS